jgi:hypothetical protein
LFPEDVIEIVGADGVVYAEFADCADHGDQTPDAFEARTRSV